MQTEELNKNEMVKINGGSITSTVINAIVNAVDFILELGEKTGSSIRRLIEGNICASR